MTFDQAQSPRLGQRTPVENPGVRLVTLETLPEVAYRGQIVYLLDRDEFRVYDGVAWQNPTASATGGTQTFVGPTAPVADATGDLWMNNTTFQLYVWNGSIWQPAVDPAAQAAAANASNALSQASTALGLVNGKTTIWYMPTQPLTPAQAVVAGDYWVNTITNKLYHTTDAVNWDEVQDQDIAAAVNAAGTAQATADQKITTYTMAWGNRPLDLGPEDIGDLLFAIDQGNKSYRWDGADWVELSSSQVDNIEVGTSFSLASGSVSHVQNNATLTIDGSARRPNVAPTFTHTYETIPFTLSTLPTTSWTGANTVEFAGTAYDAASDRMYQAVNVYNTSKSKCKSMVYEYSYSAGGAELSRHDVSINETNELIDIAVSGTKVYLLTREITSATPFIRILTKSTLLFQALNRQLAASSLIGIYANSTYLHLARPSSSTGNVEIARYDATSLLFVDTLSSTQALTKWGRGLQQVTSAAGITGNKFIMNLSGSTAAPLFCSFDPNVTAGTFTRVTTESWDSLPNNVAGFFHDGTNFYQVIPRTSVGVWSLNKYTNDAWTATGDGTRWASAAFRQVNVTTGATTYRTTESPRVKITARKRMRLHVTGPTLAAGGDANAISIYLGKGTVEPLLTDMHLQTPELVIGARTILYDDSRLPSFTGANPLLVGTFPDGTPGAIISQTVRLDGTPKTNLDGIGTANIDGLLPPGSITLYARSSAPTGWHMCDGAALSRTGFPDLFAAIGTTFGTGNGTTTFNIPTKTDTSLFYIIKL